MMGHVAVGRNPRAQLTQQERPDIVAEINLKFGDHLVTSLVDTGCSTTCVSEDIIRKLRIFQRFEFCYTIVRSDDSATERKTNMYVIFIKSAFYSFEFSRAIIIHLFLYRGCVMISYQIKNHATSVVI